MLAEIKKADITHSINTFQNRTVVFICPNYEDRSIEFVEELLEEFDATQILFVIVELLGKAKVGILDERVSINRRTVIAKFKDKRIPYEEMRLPYPTVDLQEEVKNAFIRSIKDSSAPINAIVDVSCLPSGLLLSIMSIIDEENDKHKTFHRVYIYYASPSSYPNVDHPQSIGVIRGDISKHIDLKNLTGEKSVTLVVFPGREGFEAKQVLDYFSHVECEKHIMLMFSRDNPILSLPVLWNNQLVISESKDRDTFVEFYFTLEDGLRRLKNIYQKALANSEAFFIAPFGPKPLMIGAYQLIKKFIHEKENEKDHPRFMADLILLSSFQYTSTYSIGSGLSNFFEYKLDYLQL
jgi:hypothetical protein